MKKWLVLLTFLVILAAGAGWGITRLILPKIPTKPNYTQADYDSGRKQVQDFWMSLVRSRGSTSVLSLTTSEINALVDREVSRMVISAGRQLEGVAVRTRDGTVNVETAMLVTGGSIGFGLDLKPSAKDGHLRLDIIEARVAGIPVPTSRLLEALGSRFQLPPGISLNGDGSLTIQKSVLGPNGPFFEDIEVRPDGLKVSMQAPK